jgi:hypothetical protein
MEKTRSNRRGIGCVSTFLLFLLFVFANLSYLSFALRWSAYEHGVSQYLVEQKKKNGKWPANLNDFPQFSQSLGADR